MTGHLTAESVRRDGLAMTPATAHRIAEKFRREIGGLYAVLIAPRIEWDHRRSPKDENR